LCIFEEKKKRTRRKSFCEGKSLSVNDVNISKIVPFLGLKVL